MSPRHATALFSVLLAARATAAEPPSLCGRYLRDRVSAIDDPDWRGIVARWSAEYRADSHLIEHGANGMELDSLWRLDGDLLTLSDLAGSGSRRVSGIDSAAGRCRIERRGDEIRSTCCATNAARGAACY